MKVILSWPHAIWIKRCEITSELTSQVNYLFLEFQSQWHMFAEVDHSNTEVSG